ncbi:MAG: hypothetical protein HQL68_11480 [Magnetococcales bacterium]|nr:hypothetical protein [Magnetococcales bacterium]
MSDNSKSSGVWNIKNIDMEVRTACTKAAKKKGVTLYTWINEALRSAAVNELKGQHDLPTIELGEELDAIRAAFIKQNKTLRIEMSEIKALLTDQRIESKSEKLKPGNNMSNKSKAKSKKDKKKKVQQ